MNKPSSSARFLLAFCALGLAAVLGTSISYRLSDHPLVKQISAQQAVAPAAQSGEAPASGGMEAMAQAMQNDPEQAAMIAFMQKLQADANDPDALLGLADIFLRRGELGSAEGFVNRAAVSAPADGRPSFYLGIIRERQGRYGEAAEQLKRSLGIQENPSARFSLAVLYIYRLNDKAAGKAQLEAALAVPELDAGLKQLVETELAKL